MGDGNLMSQSATNGMPGFQTGNDVVQIQQAIERLLTGGLGRQENVPLVQTIQDAEYSRLWKIYQDALTKEDQFYSNLGINMNFADLYDKTVSWNSLIGGEGIFLKNNSLINKIKNIYKKYSGSAFYENVEKTASSIKEKDWKDIMTELFGEQIDFQVIKDMRAAVKSSSSGSGKHTEIVFPGNYTPKKGREAVAKGITVAYNSDGTLSLHFNKDIPKDLQQRIEGLMAERTEQGMIKTMSESRQKMYNEIITAVKSVLGETTAYSAIENVITKHWYEIEDIALNRATSAVKGFLGEVYWTAFFNYIGLPAIPAGVNLKNLKGQETPTDILVKGLGFQVKNYSAINGVVTFNGYLDKRTEEMVPSKVSLHTFLSGSNRMAFSEEEATTFGKFYFSFYYNKRNEERDKNGRFTGIEKKSQDIFDNVPSFIEANSIKLLNMDGNVELKDKNVIPMFNLPPDFNAGKPTFYLINSVPIAGSEIIQAIMFNLHDRNMTNSSSAVWIEPNSVSVHTNPFDTGKRWPEGSTEPPIMTMMTSGQAYVTYIVRVNLQSLVERLLLKANQKVQSK